ncbi:hypothetical protein [Kingella kingae]|jgi:hypothetical protein|uniref:hypothetical protein n=2 Tax=Kingella kingae TaxID=504 RepID=UPI000C3292DF|nr:MULTISPECIES: hypothetical protein [Neisseriaceae]MDK4556303.1 hypothetical protein [Kingella kingae]MDK4581431.1 hypothetical protein [Kingella kingae]MDK4587452.1 hypothetical protein [Kingella kingae]MDK4609525.1 hypothetical protein [Kingella kingae]MDK4637421.1 hypothetical protein [Kingella kingae]
MFVLEGTLINIFETPKGTTKDGEKYGGDDRIQVMHEISLSNGAKRVDLVDLKVPDVVPYRDKLNAVIRVPVAISVYQGKLSIKVTA